MKKQLNGLIMIILIISFIGCDEDRIGSEPLQKDEEIIQQFDESSANSNTLDGLSDKQEDSVFSDSN